MSKRIKHGTLFGSMPPEQQCTGKEPFPNGAIAHRTAERMASKRKRRGEVQVYRCPHCGKFHIGGSYK